MPEVLSIHEDLIAQYGGAQGVRDMGALESALFRPQSGYYEDLIQEACALLESLAMHHPIVDANKRVAFGAMEVFLMLNGHEVVGTSMAIHRRFIKDQAAGRGDLTTQRWRSSTAPWATVASPVATKV